MSRFETATDGNIYILFKSYQAEANKLSNAGLMKIETHLHEILYLTNILVLAPNQHSQLLLESFSANTLDQLHQSLLNQAKNIKKEASITDDKYEETIIKMSNCGRQKLTRSDAELELLYLAKGQNYYLSRTIRGITNA